jgi:MOSC domain-containing protein YiiM
MAGHPDVTTRGADGQAMRVVAVATSAVRGVPKQPVARIRLVADHGVAGDAHAGPGERQVSLLALEGIRRMEARTGTTLGFGRFGENVVIDGPLDGLAPGDVVAIGDDAVLEVTVIGKTCHHGCAIREQAGDCIMPREGVFARVVRSGDVAPGSPVRFGRMP